jgi:trans-aconitate methyltransferase
VGGHFIDIVYSCLLVIKMPDNNYDDGHDNQSGTAHRRFSMRRLRALELIRQSLQTLSKYVELNSE